MIDVETPPVETAADRERAELVDLQARQTQAARENRLRKAARRDPAVEEFYLEYQAVSAGAKELREKYAAATAANEALTTSVAELRSALELADQTNAALREQLAQALKKPAKG